LQLEVFMDVVIHVNQPKTQDDDRWRGGVVDSCIRAADQIIHELGVTNHREKACVEAELVSRLAQRLTVAARIGLHLEETGQIPPVESSVGA
jgi:hypothetical protein